MITVNGAGVENAQGKTIAEYLAESGYDKKRVAVERNGGIVPKSSYDTTILQDGDSVEVVSFVGGG
ncbi:MAG: sulfur carrier protein ThiS [Ruminococcus sp.]|nr:sulfur carrier protein ThiS [Ruminococcus sp.]